MATFPTHGTTNYDGPLQTYIDSKAPMGVDNVVIGVGTLHTPSANTKTSLSGEQVIANPNVTFMGAVSGFASYSGTQGVSAGSLQGGACEAFVRMTGTVTSNILGWECIGDAGSTGTYSTVIGGQSTAFVQDTATVTNLIGYQGAPPFSNGGTPTVTNAYTMKLQEPSVGTNRYSFYGAGRHRFSKGVHANVFEVCASGDLLQWASNGSTLIGYASDGASSRITLDPTDGNDKITVAVTGTGKALVLSTNGSGNIIEAQVSGTPKFAVLSDGTLWLNQPTTTTAPAAGGAGALPATPLGYMTLTINGTARKVAYY